MELVVSDKESEFKNPLIIKAFIETINNPADVTHLFLDFNNINSNLATILSLKIKEMINLKHITLKLYIAASEEIEDIFIKIFENINCTLIESVDFDFDFDCFEAPRALCKFLDQANNLEFFKISDPHKKKTIIISLLQNLINSKCKIKYLNISYSRINWIIERLGPLINQLKSLETLFINNNDLSAYHLSVFLKDIKHLKLKHLDFFSNRMSLESCSLLGNMFGKNEIKMLDISDCCIYDEYLLAFLNGWEQGINTKKQQDDIQTSLEELVLAQLNTKKMHELFKIHKLFFSEAEKEKREYKQILDLSYNKITQRGIDVLTSFMKDKFNIKIEFCGYSSYNTSKLVNVVETNLGCVNIKFSLFDNIIL
ncbi:hypothetical protein CDIK_3132 [Cucumispora dikerogammari]|nr:hypothetical protein CDIK_3132 [Cucumispora dikerogammari]